MKIVLLEGNAVNPGDLSWDILGEFGDVTIYQSTPPEEAIAQIGNAEIVLINKTPITAQLLDACPSIRLICVQATGYDSVDCKAAAERGITVCNVPTYGTNAVAQFTFALLLELCNRVGHHDLLVHQGVWSSGGHFCFWDTPQSELAGKTMGIIGYGRIGRAVGKIAEAFGMKVLVCSRSYPDAVPMDTLLERSDIVSLHCPLTAETIEMVDSAFISKMKDGAILLNTARGRLVNEEALADALCSGKLRGAAADVVSKEPIDPANPLLRAPNCIITPHMAWGPTEARQRIIDCTVKNIRGFLEGNIINAVC